MVRVEVPFVVIRFVVPLDEGAYGASRRFVVPNAFDHGDAMHDCISKLFAQHVLKLTFVDHNVFKYAATAL